MEQGRCIEWGRCRRDARRQEAPRWRYCRRLDDTLLSLFHQAEIVSRSDSEMFSIHTFFQFFQTALIEINDIAFKRETVNDKKWRQFKWRR